MSYNNSFWGAGSLTHLEGKTFESFDEVLKACGLDFTAEKVDLYHKDSEGRELMQPYASCIRREDDLHPLGVTSTTYGITQFREWFSIGEGLCENGVTLVEGGLGGHGARAYLLLRGEGSIKLGENDKILNEFVITTSHDGTAKLTFLMTPRRTGNQSVVSTGSPILSFKHSKRVANKVLNVNHILSTVKGHWEEFSVATRKMSQVKMTEVEAREFIVGVVGDGDSTRTQNIRNKIYDLWAFAGVGRSVPMCNKTLFGLVQSVCEYSDHHKTVRKSKYLDEGSATIESKTLGDAAKQKAKGWALALTLIRKKSKLSGLTPSL